MYRLADFQRTVVFALNPCGSNSADTYDPNILDTDTRTWTDANLDNIAQINELGPSQNKTFGVKAPRRPGDGIQRPYQIDLNAASGTWRTASSS